MKKITLGLVLLVMLYCFAGCGNNTSKKEADPTKQKDVQVIIASGDNFKAKKDLLLSSELNPNGLIALCNNPKPMNINNSDVRCWFIDAIERTELTEEQEVQIAKLGESTYNEALLHRTNLTGDGLVAVCEHPGSLNIEAYDVQCWFQEAVERTKLTAKQEVQIAKLGKSTYNKALLHRTNLTGDGLVAVCEHPGSLNIEAHDVRCWFQEAVARTELTEEQKALIAGSKVGGLGLY